MFSFTLHDVQQYLHGADFSKLSREVKHRLRILQYYCEHDCNVSATCRHFGIARTTFLRWAKRFQPDDVFSLAEKSRAPKKTRESTVSNRVVAIIRRIRENDHYVSADRIAEYITKHKGIQISAATVGRVIHKEGFFFGTSPSHMRKRKRQAAPQSDAPDQYNEFLWLEPL